MVDTIKKRMNSEDLSRVKKRPPPHAVWNGSGRHKFRFRFSFPEGVVRGLQGVPVHPFPRTNCHRYFLDPLLPTNKGKQWLTVKLVAGHGVNSRVVGLLCNCTSTVIFSAGCTLLPSAAVRHFLLMSSLLRLPLCSSYMYFDVGTI